MKKLSIILLIFIVVSRQQGFAQAPTILWQHCYGGSAQDAGYAACNAADGGYFIAGAANSSDGDAGGFITTGTDANFLVIKTDAGGAVQWTYVYGVYEGFGDEIPYSIEQTSDGGCIVAGTTQSTMLPGYHGGGCDGLVVKLSSSGTQEWARCIGTSGNDFLRYVHQTTDGTYFLIGYTSGTDGIGSGNHGMEDVVAVKLDDTGAVTWSRCYGGSSYNEIRCATIDNNGNYLMGAIGGTNDGDLSSNIGLADVWILTINGNGDIDNQQFFNSGNDGVLCSSVQQAPDGGYVLTATCDINDNIFTGNHGYVDFGVAKISAEGNLEWGRSFGGSGADNPLGLIIMTDGSISVAGITSWYDDGDVDGTHGHYDGWVINLNPTGGLNWQKCLGGSLHDELSTLIRTSDNNLLTVGFAFSNDGDVSGVHSTQGDVWALKMAISNGVRDVAKQPLNIYPTHCRDGIVYIKQPELIDHPRIDMIDVAGRFVKVSTTYSQNEITIKIGPEVAAGVYYLRVNGHGVLPTIKAINYQP